MIFGALSTISAGQNVLSLAGSMEIVFWYILVAGAVLSAATIEAESVIVKKKN